MVTYYFRRANSTSPYSFENVSASDQPSRRDSAVEVSNARRPSLANLSLRFSSRPKKPTTVSDVGVASDQTHLLWESLLALPDEITSQILCYLSLPDIFSLRLTSRSVHTYLQYHAGPISRSVLLQNAYEHTADHEGHPNHDKARYLYNYTNTIYPPPQPCTSFDYLLQTLKRQSQIDKMLAVLTNWLQMKVYIFPKFKRCDNFSTYRHKLTRRLHLAAWTLYHFLESYRNILVIQHPTHKDKPFQANEDGHGQCFRCLQDIRKLLRTYSGQEIVPAYHFYDLCRQHLLALSRAPSAGRLRAKKSTNDADLVQILVFGGIPELCKLSLLKGSANQRIDSISSFVDKVAGAAVQQRIRASGSTTSVKSDHTSLSGELVTPLQTPFHLIHHSTISALPELDRFINGSEEWLSQMFSSIHPGEQIVGAWGFVTNILTGKSDGKASIGPSAQGEDCDQDFLTPVKDFDD